VRNLNPRPPNKPAVRLFFGFFSVIMLIGVCILAYGLHLLIKSANSAGWPSTDGTVKTADIERNSGDNGTTYAAEVTYDYRINGTLYTGNKIRMVKISSSSTSDARADLNKYPVDKKVKVYYSPADCTDCILEPGIHPSSWFLVILGGVFTGFPLILFVLTLVFGVTASRTVETAVENDTRLS
jgi:hypothetical protein